MVLRYRNFRPKATMSSCQLSKLRDLRAGNTAGADKASARIQSEYVVIDGDILFSWSTTMGHIQRKHLTDAMIAVASPDAMEKFDTAIAPMFDQLVCNAQQSRTLAQLRDTLLPKPISGELRVPEAETFLPERMVKRVLRKHGYPPDMQEGG